MTNIEVENYLKAIDYFDKHFEPQQQDEVKLTKILDRLYINWPNTSITLAEQGFFTTILQIN